MIDKIVANQWMLELTFIVFCVVAVIIVEIIKKIIQTVVEKRGGTFDKKKYEYVFSLAAFTIAFVGISMFMYAYCPSVDYGISRISKAFTYALGTQGAYSLLTQPLRKTFAKIASLIKKIGNKTVTPDDVKDLLKTDENSDEENAVLEPITKDEKCESEVEKFLNCINK